MATESEKIELLLRQKTLNDVVLAGYMMFLNDKGLLAQADDYVKGFINVFNNEEIESVFLQKKALFDKEIADYDAKRGAK